MDLGRNPRDNELLSIFVIGLIRTPRNYSYGYVSIGPIAQKESDQSFKY